MEVSHLTEARDEDSILLTSPEKEMGIQEKDDCGFIFMCNARTKFECYRYRVFGLPAERREVAEKITPGTKLFLFDFEEKILYGVYEATSAGQLNLEPAAFGGNFPAQVKFKIAKECFPLTESYLKHVIKENYNGLKFKQELGSEQVKKLLSSFQPLDALPSQLANQAFLLGAGKEPRTQKQVSGFIFMCNPSTKIECHRFRVFGLPMGKRKVVEEIKPGAKLFLFDIELKLLYGIYEATSAGKVNLEPAAFGGRYPAQVKFKIFKECLPLHESSLKYVIKENYNGSKFRQELCGNQVRKLLSSFEPLTVTSSQLGIQAVSQLWAMPPATDYQFNHSASLRPMESPFSTEVRYRHAELDGTPFAGNPYTHQQGYYMINAQQPYLTEYTANEWQDYYQRYSTAVHGQVNDLGRQYNQQPSNGEPLYNSYNHALATRYTSNLQVVPAQFSP